MCVRTRLNTFVCVSLVDVSGPRLLKCLRNLGSFFLSCILD